MVLSVGEKKKKNALKKIANLFILVPHFNPEDVNVECKCNFNSKETYYYRKFWIKYSLLNFILPSGQNILQKVSGDSAVIEKCLHCICTFYMP